MNKLRVLFLFIFLAIFTVCGQEKKYVSYTVKAGETLKSIARDNGLKPKDLVRLNPDVKKKPNSNTVIIIPNPSYLVGGKNNSDAIFHTVLKKENLFGISQKYGVTVEAIKEINNLQGAYLSQGRIIQIPEKKIELGVVVSPIDSLLIRHMVVKDNTLYGLSKKYNTSENQLLLMNPELKDGLKLGMVITVGRKKSKGEEVSSVVRFKDSIADKYLKIVLMLPYRLDTNTFYEDEFESKNSLINVVTDFHAGAMIAIDSLRRQGMYIQLDVFDTESKYKVSKIKEIVDGYDFSDVDAVIGPLFMKNAKQLSVALSETTIVSPIYSKKQTSISENNLVKVAPNKALIAPRLIDYLLATYSGEKIILIGDSSPESASKINSLTERFKEVKAFDITVIKPKYGYIAKDRFIEVIDTVQKKNWVVLLSNDDVVTSDVVNNLGVMPYEDRDIQLFAYNRGSNFKGVNSDRLARLKFTFPASEFIDASSVEVRSFFKMYKDSYYVRPSAFAIRGFDVTYDALMRLSNTDKFSEGKTQGVSERVYTKFDYHKRWFGSIENKGVFLLQYQKNLELKSLD
jgi:LysM repeat protein